MKATSNVQGAAARGQHLSQQRVDNVVNSLVLRSDAALRLQHER